MAWKAFGVGAMTVGFMALIVFIALGPIAHGAGWSDLDLSIGPMSIFAYESNDSGFSTSFGPGILLLALAGGVLNAIGAALLRDRSSA
jgi:hypothetical protein